jgi:hypothetical protein
MIDQISKLKDHVNVSIMKAVQVDESKKLNYWALKSCRIYCLEEMRRIDLVWEIVKYTASLL